MMEPPLNGAIARAGFLGHAANKDVTVEHEVAQLFEEARDDVYRYLLTLGVHPPQAQEATQEVFLRLYMALKKGDRIENVRGWIFRVAHNQGLTLRGREDAARPFDPELEIRVPDPRDDPERALLDRERWLGFHRAVENLSEQQQRCLYLRAEGFRYREIAAILGISDSAVGEFLRRAIGRLRKALHA
jgi:RNA polymerase sigma-70 factor, ECF subfamily